MILNNNVSHKQQGQNFGMAFRKPDAKTMNVLTEILNKDADKTSVQRVIGDIANIVDTQKGNNTVDLVLGSSDNGSKITVGFSESGKSKVVGVKSTERGPNFADNLIGSLYTASARATRQHKVAQENLPVGSRLNNIWG